MGLFDNPFKGLFKGGGLNDSIGNIVTQALDMKAQGDLKALRKKIAETEEIDDVTRGELLDVFMRSSNPREKLKQAQDLYARASEGKGIFAVRRINQAQQEALQDRPGRGQTVLSLTQGALNSRSVL